MQVAARSHSELMAKPRAGSEPEITSASIRDGYETLPQLIRRIVREELSAVVRRDDREIDLVPETHGRKEK